MVKKCLRAWIFGPALKLFFWSTLVTPKSINNDFNQPGHSSHSFYAHSSHSVHYQKDFTDYERSWTDSWEPRHKTQGKKACDLLLSMRHVVAKIIRKHTWGLNESKDPYLRSITYIHTHIPMYVSKANIFILLTSANYGPIYLIDFTNITNFTNTHGQTILFSFNWPQLYFLQRPLGHNMNIVFLIIFILFVMIIILFVS